MTRIAPDSTPWEVLRRFGEVAAAVESARKPSHAAIAQVWLLDEGLVLRARAQGLIVYSTT